MQRQTKSLIVVMKRPRDEASAETVRSKGQKDTERLRAADITGLVGVSFYELRPKVLSQESQARAHWRLEDHQRLQSGQFATFYEVSDPEPFVTYDEIKESLEDDSELSTLIYEGCFSRQVDLHPEYYTLDATYETHGVLVAMTHPLEEERYEDWYVPIHLMDEALHGIHHSVTRFINCEAEIPKSVAILETDWKDIVEARRQVQEKHVPRFRWWTDRHEVFFAGEYQRIV